MFRGYGFATWPGFQGGGMHLRLTLLTADPKQLQEAVHFIEDEARPLVEGEPGNLGMSLKVKSPLGVALVETFWVSGDAMRESDRNVRATREQAADRVNGTLSVEGFQVASMLKVAPWEPGNGVRITRLDSELSQLDQFVAAYEDTALPWLTEAGGFCGAFLGAHRSTGHSISETLWQDDAALAESRSVAAAIRVDAVKATNSAVRSLEEYTLVFSSARKA
jgi:hypothetical protein